MNNNDYHNNPTYHFEKEKSTAILKKYQLNINQDIEYQISDEEATKILYGTLLTLLIITIINLFLI